MALFFKFQVIPVVRGKLILLFFQSCQAMQLLFLERAVLKVLIVGGKTKNKPVPLHCNQNSRQIHAMDIKH